MVAAGRMRRGSAASPICRSFAHWVLRFNAPDRTGWFDGKSPGAPSKINADHRRALAEVVEAGPVPAVDGVVPWRAQGPGAVRSWRLRHLIARRDHFRARVEGARLRQDLGAAAPLRAKRAGRRGFCQKLRAPRQLAKIRAKAPESCVEIELWWRTMKPASARRISLGTPMGHDVARARGRPQNIATSARGRWAYVLRRICPAKGKGAGLVLPWLTPTPWRRIIETSAAVDPGACRC